MARKRADYAGPERRASSRRTRILFAVWAVALTVVVIWTAQQSRARQAEGLQAHDALCVFKQDLQRRASSSAEFLRTHPNGIAGIPAKVLQQSLANQVSTIRSLDRLRCDPPPAPVVTVTTSIDTTP